MSALDVLRALGFEVVGTGGGCEALYFQRPDGETCLVTDDLSVPAEDGNWEVGFYEEPTGEYDGVLCGEPYDSGVFTPDRYLTALERIARWRVG